MVNELTFNTSYPSGNPFPAHFDHPSDAKSTLLSQGSSKGGEEFNCMVINNAIGLMSADMLEIRLRHCLPQSHSLV